MLVSVAELSNIFSVLAVLICFCGVFLFIMRCVHSVPLPPSVTVRRSRAHERDAQRQSARRGVVVASERSAPCSNPSFSLSSFPFEKERGREMPMVSRRGISSVIGDNARDIPLAPVAGMRVYRGDGRNAR